MKTKRIIAAGIVIIVAAIIFATYYLIARSDQETLVAITTDKPQYFTRETVHIRIENMGDRSINIYCPAWCALGNFPTSVERYSNGGWQYYAGFCPSIEPLFSSGLLEGEYIRHNLGSGNHYELEISNLDALHLEGAVKLRIVYYLGKGKYPVYSNEFIVTR